MHSIYRSRAPEADAKAREVEEVLKEFPGPFPKRRLMRLQGLLALARGQHREAIRLLESVDALLPASVFIPDGQHVETWFGLGKAWLALGEDRQAAEWFDRVANAGFLRITNPFLYVRSHYHLGEIHEGLGEPEEAREHYRRFLGYWEDGEIDRERVEHALAFLQED